MNYFMLCKFSRGFKFYRNPQIPPIGRERGREREMKGVGGPTSQSKRAWWPICWSSTSRIAAGKQGNWKKKERERRGFGGFFGGNFRDNSIH